MAAFEALDMGALEMEHRAWLDKILRANDDLAVRLHTLGFTADYDEEDDALYLTIGPPTEALTESVDGSVYFRVDPNTLKLVGVEVWGIRATPLPAVVVLFMARVLQAVGRHESTQSPEAVAATHERLAAGIRELAAA